MRTTVTLDPDVADLLKKSMAERGITFKAAINQAVRAGLDPKPRRKFKQRTFDMGTPPPGINLVKALQLAGALEDEEILRKMALGK